MKGIKALVAILLSLAFLLPSASSASPAQSATCQLRPVLLARGYGAPDDVVTKGRTILFSDTTAGVVGAVKGKRRWVLLRGLNVPEGIVVRPHDRLIVVEQGANRLDTIDLHSRRRSVLLTLRNTTGLEGVDAISAAGPDLLIPNSPYGQLLRLHRGRLEVVTNGLARPVDAVPYAGGIAVADENANAIWLVRSGRVTRLATVSIPDDVVVYHGHLLAVTLGDGALWEIRPRVRRLLGGFGQPQGLTVGGGGSVIITDSRQNAVYRVSLPVSCLG